MTADAATITEADITAYRRLIERVAQVGPDRLTAAALHVPSPTKGILMLLASRGAPPNDVIDLLHLKPGELDAVLHVPAPTPLPPDQATVIPDDFPVDDGPYARRRRPVTLGDVPEPAAAALAALVPGQRGVILFMIARGDDRYDVAKTLGIAIEAVEAILAETDGDHLVRIE